METIIGLATKIVLAMIAGDVKAEFILHYHSFASGPASKSSIKIDLVTGLEVVKLSLLTLFLSLPPSFAATTLLSLAPLSSFLLTVAVSMLVAAILDLVLLRK